MSEKPKKPKEPKVETEPKTPAQLEEAYRNKVAYFVQNVDKWLDKTAKASHSRKYDLGNDKREFIIAHLSKKLATTIEVIRGKKVEVEKFKLN